MNAGVSGGAEMAMGVGAGAGGAVSAGVGSVTLGCGALGSPAERQGMKVPGKRKKEQKSGHLSQLCAASV